MSRNVPEWIGATPDTSIPPRVRLRVWERDKGICQCGCGWTILAGGDWDADHRVPLIAGGENRESNLQVMLRMHHKEKTRQDVADKSKSYRIRARNAGIKKPRTITRWRKFSGEIVQAGRNR